jgi:hypothetical protein
MTASAYGAGAPANTIAFHYAAVFPPDAVRWYTRFQLLVTGAILAAEQTQALREGGGKLAAYEWSTGLYPGEPSSHREWESLVLANRAWLLAANPSGGGSAARNRVAFWYDFGNPELRRHRARWLAHLLEQSGYEGYFFDTVGFEQLPEEMRAEFSRRWPKLDYNRCQGEFLGELRSLTGPQRLIFLNQGYRHAAELLPHADLDLTESYFTALEGTRTRFRTWDDPRTPWESIRVPMEKLVIPAGRQFPNVRFVHVNYSTPDVAGRAARYSWAVSRLWDHAAYLIVPGDPAGERDPIYFRDTGAPAEEHWQSDGEVLYRTFERGVVAVNPSGSPGRIGPVRTVVPAGPDGFFFPRR